MNASNVQLIEIKFPGMINVLNTFVQATVDFLQPVFSSATEVQSLVENCKPSVEFKRYIQNNSDKISTNPIREKSIFSSYNFPGMNVRIIVPDQLDVIGTSAIRYSISITAENQKMLFLNETFPVVGDIIVLKGSANLGVTTGAAAMYDRLVQHRDKFERNGMTAGIVLAVISLCTSLLAKVPWNASIPASFTFLSLAGLMIMRRYLRGGTK